MAQAAEHIKKYTYEDYLKTPDEIRYELIEGDLIMTPAPTVKHQRLSRKIEFILERFVEENGLGEVFYAPCDVHLDDENVLQPDIMFISKERSEIIGEKSIHGAPDLAIEILSESSAYRDMVQKKIIYARFGVKEYWIVSPEEASVEIFVLKENTFRPYKAYIKGETLESPLLSGLKIELQKVF